MTRQQTRCKLSAIAVKAARPGKYNDGGGLWLHKTSRTQGRWFYRFQLDGRRREMGLGSLADVTLQGARQSADDARAIVCSGRDPIEERARRRRNRTNSDTTLRYIAEQAFEARKADLREDGIAGRWFSPLEHHVLPALGSLQVTDIDAMAIYDTLLPIWHDKAPTAKKAIWRLGVVMQHAAARGLDVDMQATDKARALLGGQKHQVRHIAAMPWSDVPAFYATLAEPTSANLALRLIILTGHRTKPVRFLERNHIEGSTWTTPAHLMKGLKRSAVAFRCHLSDEALAVIELAKSMTDGEFLFPSAKNGVLSDATLSRKMERLGLEARPHGFRSSFRQWLEHQSMAPYEVREAMLQHIVGTAVAKSYTRTDYFEQRAPLYDHWARFVTKGS
ncbi:MAG: integrase arm-type DNA-binding domain-containing protein [Hyphomonas sp.]|nr:integrase arm-type DNA-binding domain-containing protein [Hyphomonas sp.]